MISELQRDALAEIFNIAIGRAASVLSDMTNRKIELSVTEVDLLLGNKIDVTFLNSCVGICSGHIMSSSVKFGDEYTGKAFLLFPASQAKILVNLCLDQMEPDDSFVVDEKELLDTDFDVMKEIGNIILNSVIGGLANLLVTKLTYSLPEVETFFVSSENQVAVLQNNIYLLTLKTLFSIANTQLRGAILIIMGMDSIDQLIRKINDMLE
jgi:Chemotaxis protein CheC, inhibitor of MCP methylation